MTSTLGFRISAFGLAISAFGFRFCDFGFRNLQSAISNGVGRFGTRIIPFIVLIFCVRSLGFATSFPSAAHGAIEGRFPLRLCVSALVSLPDNLFNAKAQRRGECGCGISDFGFGVADLLSYTSDSAIRNPQSAMELNGVKRPVAFKHEPNKLVITIGGEPFATYVYEDSETTRPYFAHVRTPAGIQATRNHPPIEGKDPTDHAAYHPGIWLTFADINGNDYWRLKARTVHDKFVFEPQGGAGRGTFTVRNRYLSAEGDKTVCVETCRYTILVRAAGYLLICDSSFTSDAGDFYFGDQEEFGLGVRVATPISVRKGGHITDSQGRRDEKQVWGKQADWCDYSGTIDGQRVGITVMPNPNNFRRCWYHARDYGLVVANPFGRNAMTKGAKSKVVVQKGETFHLGYAVFIYSTPANAKVDIDAVYQDYLKTIAAKTGQ